MPDLLNSRERKLLEHLQLESDTFQVRGQLPVGVGVITLDRLTQLGLLQSGVGRFGDTGWKLTPDGWRCMYGIAQEEMTDEGAPYHPLKVWSWPPTIDASASPKKAKTRLKMLELRLATLRPRLKTLD